MAEEKEMNKYQRYYALHREECNALRLARYHKSPAVVARREEKERLKAEKEVAKQAEKEAAKLRKKAEREEKHKEKTQLALATKKITKKTTPLGEFLIQTPPVEDASR